MKKENLKNQILSNIDIIIDIVLKGNTAEVKKNKDGILILETSRKKLNLELNEDLNKIK